MKTICKGTGCWLILALIILSSFLAGKSCGQDLSSWNLYPQAITSDNGYILFKKAEPNGDGVAYVVYFLLGEVNTLSVIHVKVHGNCFTGTRSVKNGQSYVLYYGVPCRSFDGLHEMYETATRKPPKPLEEQ